MRNDDARERLTEISSQLVGAQPVRLQELLGERRELLLGLARAGGLEGASLADAARAGTEARLPLVARRESLRARIKELRLTRAALRSLRASPSNLGRRLDLLG